MPTVSHCFNAVTSRQTLGHCKATPRWTTLSSTKVPCFFRRTGQGPMCAWALLRTPGPPTSPHHPPPPRPHRAIQPCYRPPRDVMPSSRHQSHALLWGVPASVGTCPKTRWSVTYQQDMSPVDKPSLMPCCGWLSILHVPPVAPSIGRVPTASAMDSRSSQTRQWAYPMPCLLRCTWHQVACPLCLVRRSMHRVPPWYRHLKNSWPPPYRQCDIYPMPAVARYPVVCHPSWKLSCSSALGRHCIVSNASPSSSFAHPRGLGKPMPSKSPRISSDAFACSMADILPPYGVKQQPWRKGQK